MSESGHEVGKDAMDESLASFFREEEFREVYGGTVPISTPWLGLSFR